MTDNYWPAAIINIQKAQRSSDQLLGIMGWEGVNEQILESFYLAIVQAVLLFDAETWVVYPHIGRVLGGLHHRSEQWISGKQL